MIKQQFIVLVFLLLIGSLTNNNVQGQTKSKLEGSISISGAFALYPMAVKWAEEFRKLHPKVKIDLSAGGAGKGMTDAVSKMVDIGMVSREIYPEETKKGAFAIAVTKDAVVATISATNPQLAEILAKGLKAGAANDIWITGKCKNWAQAVGTKKPAPIRVYTRSDACGAAESWAKFLGKKQEDLLGVGVFGDPGLAQAVSKDPLGIGFNNIGYVYDIQSKKPYKGMVVLPFDLNNNGKVDADENFYQSLDKLVEAIAAGKYPSPPARDLYFVTAGKPTKRVVVEFIAWVLTDGQKFVHDSGFINLSKEKLEKELKRIK